MGVRKGERVCVYMFLGAGVFGRRAARGLNDAIVTAVEIDLLRLPYDRQLRARACGRGWAGAG